MIMIQLTNKIILTGSLMLFTMMAYGQQDQPIVVNADRIKAEIQPTMWGIFYEDINFAADGGIYAELVKNRSFEFYKPKMGWALKSKPVDSSQFNIINRGTSHEGNARFARIKAGLTSEPLCITNGGFRGMGIKKDNSYLFSVMAFVHDGSDVSLRVELLNAKGIFIGGTTLKPEGKEWKKYTATFTALDTDAKASLNIWFEGKGIVDIDVVSLFPGDTWKNRPNGMRADLVQLLADLKPGFLRFPGGCIVEGHDLNNRYQWKKTIGDPGERPVIMSRWNIEFKHRLTPDYFQSFGLGFYEYFLLAEDIGAAPLPILNCGMACQFNTGELVPVEDLGPYIQDALDLIEFANGPAESGWGKIRAEMGHPAPFNLKLLGIGNEQWGPQYFERYTKFEEAIRAKYPEIKLVSGTGPAPDGDLYDYAVKELPKYDPAIVDEHYYRDPEWFFNNASRYDSYDRSRKYKIFAGEYAAQSVGVCSPLNQNNWKCALSEAAFMTGLERNADIVHLSSYAPLFGHVEGWQWIPDLIWFDNLRSYGTLNYFVQQMFSVNKGTHLLEMTWEGKPLAGQQSLYASAVLDKGSGEIILKMVNASAQAQAKNIVLQTTKKPAAGAKLITLQSARLDAVNSFDTGKNIMPVEQEITVKGKKLDVTLPPYSLSVYRIRYK